jgi:hypothetical protein
MARRYPMEAVPDDTPLTPDAPAAPPPQDAWMSLAEFGDEVCESDPAKRVPLAGFSVSVAGKRHKYRGEWRRLFGEWLAREGF